MGGITGEIRGHSKAVLYGKYVEMVKNLRNAFQNSDPDPEYKKKCKSLMVWDPDAGEWVLRYHLHT